MLMFVKNVLHLQRAIKSQGRAEVARCPHKAKVGGSNPSPATSQWRVTIAKNAKVTTPNVSH